MTTKVFDHEQMNPELFSGLHTPRATASFTHLVHVYMEYLRSDPRQTDTWDEEKEVQTAETFVKMVNNDVAWPRVKHVVPEFRTRVYVSQHWAWASASARLTLIRGQ